MLSLSAIIPLMAFSQMNMTKLVTQFPELKLPYETPIDMPPNMPYWDEDPDLTAYEFIKSEVTNLFEESVGAKDDMMAYHAIGKISKEKYTAVIYLLKEVSKISGALSYRVFINTYLKNGELITSKELRSNSYYNIHEYESTYEGPREDFESSHVSRIFEIAGTLYLATTETSQTNRFILLNTETYDEELLIVQKQSETQVYSITPEGKLELLGDN
jgi:hypothetical protein